MFRKAALLAFSLIAIAHGQQAGTQTPETHPTLPSQKCTTGGTCTSSSTSVVLDSNWRWVHTTTGYTNCYTGNTWDATICPDPDTCAENCALDGADYASTYGITSSGDALTLNFVTGSNVGSRVYLMQDDTTYQMFQLMNQEFTFDVDVSKLPCGLNGAVYFVQMDSDGGMSKYPNNKAGAKFGTGYCDSQCPQDIKFINGEANIIDWTPSTGDSNAGTGSYGTCCSEMDIWEANSISAAYTPHPCTVTEQTRCSGADCGQGSDRYNGICDPDGCDFNSFRMGDTTFYGSGMTVDTTQKFTIVTQFISDDGTADGNLSEIRRFYVQNGVVIPNSMSSITGVDATNSISENFCTQQKAAFGDNPNFIAKGGLTQLGSAVKSGMVLALSLWDDYAAEMLWLDSDYPVGSDPTQPGVARGTCATTSGVPSQVESQSGSASVTYSNIKYGDLNSTFTGTGTTGSSPPSQTSQPAEPSSPASGSVAQYGQCGGTGYTGATACASPYTCHVLNPYYSQCY